MVHFNKFQFAALIVEISFWFIDQDPNDTSIEQVYSVLVYSAHSKNLTYEKYSTRKWISTNLRVWLGKTKRIHKSFVTT